jgi:peptidoglycan/LPS O-acetylase OafA/YrhL
MIVVKKGAGVVAGHVPVLDGIRGLAILLVMLFHLDELRPHNGVDRAFRMVMGLGWIGVDLFFVLSGFLITRVLLNAKGTANYFRDFYARRILRIFPLYYLILATSLFLLPRFLPPDKLARFGKIDGDEMYYWTYLSNFAIAKVGKTRHGVLDVTWSLAIEEQFYLAWPAIVLLCSRKTLLRVTGVLFLMALAVRVAMHLFTSYNEFSIYVLTPCRVDGLAVGAALAVYAAEHGDLKSLEGVARRVVPAGVLAILAGGLGEELFGKRSDFGIGFGPMFNTLGLSLNALVFGSLLVVVTTAEVGSLSHRVFGSAFLRGLGKYSYCLYLVHLPIRAAIRDRVFGPKATGSRFHFPALLGSELPGQLMFYCAAGACAFAVAWLSYHLFEKRFLDLKRFFSAGVRDSSSAPSMSSSR